VTPRLVEASLKACTSLILKGGRIVRWPGRVSCAGGAGEAPLARGRRPRCRDSPAPRPFRSPFFSSSPPLSHRGAGEHWVGTWATAVVGRAVRPPAGRGGGRGCRVRRRKFPNRRTGPTSPTGPSDQFKQPRRSARSCTSALAATVGRSSSSKRRRLSTDGQHHQPRSLQAGRAYHNDLVEVGIRDRGSGIRDRGSGVQVRSGQ
jgi:hypothetical protein